MKSKKDKLFKEIMNISKKLNKKNLENMEKASNYQNLFDDLPTMLFITNSVVNSDNSSTEKFTNANKMALDILGYELYELSSKPFIDFIHTEDKKKTKEVVSESEKNNDNIYSGFINRYIKKDGSYVHIRWLGSLITPMGEVHIAENITDFLDIQKRFVSMSILFNNYPSFIIMTNIDGDVYLSNNVAREISNLSKNKIITKNISELLEYEDHIPKSNVDDFKYFNDLNFIKVKCNGTEMIIIKNEVKSSQGELMGYSYVGHTKNVVSHIEELFNN